MIAATVVNIVVVATVAKTAVTAATAVKVVDGAAVEQNILSDDVINQCNHLGLITQGCQMGPIEITPCP